MRGRLIDLAQVVRSKNAGPYELTLDVLFRDRSGYDRVRTAGWVTPALVAALYGVAEQDVLGILWFEPANALKITLRRPMVSGDPGETDVYGAQQHAPLLELEFDLPD